MSTTRGGDPLLRVLAAGVALPEHQIGITLSVGGAVLTGLLVTRDRWLAELAAHDRGSGTIAQIVGIIHEGELAGSPVLDDGGEFLHLSLARAVGRPQEAPQMWRVRISEVSGWGLGHSVTEGQEFRRARPPQPADE